MALVTGDGDGSDGGVPHGALLIDFTEAVLTRDHPRLDTARQALLEAMGPEAVVDTACIVATFEGNDRIADATGIPLDGGRGSEIVEQTGVDLGMTLRYVEPAAEA